jgi:hypothetical protein
LLIFRKKAPTPSLPTTNVTPSANVNLESVALNVNVATPSPPEVTNEEKLKTDLSRMAAAFAERFGSYSNQSNFENILDLKNFMTNQMQAWADDFIAKSRAERPDTSIYWGVTTKALKTTILNFDETKGVAEILVSTQRREATGTTTNARIYYQDIAIKFVKENGVWKVDEAIWK